jgi:hypothetical protein
MKNDIQIGQLIAIGTVLFCSVFFAYLVACGFMRIQPFTHKPEVIQFNNLCPPEKQSGGYCTK